MTAQYVLTLLMSNQVSFVPFSRYKFVFKKAVTINTKYFHYYYYELRRNASVQSHLDHIKSVLMCDPVVYKSCTMDSARLPDLQSTSLQKKFPWFQCVCD